MAGFLGGILGGNLVGAMAASSVPLPYLANLVLVLAVLLAHQLLRWDPPLLALLLALASVLGLLGSDPGYVSDQPSSESSRFCDR